MHVRQGIKTASPALGVGAWALGAPPWLAAVIGITAYLASGPASQGYAARKFWGCHAKWAQIVSRRSTAEMMQLGKALRDRYPVVYASMSGVGQELLP